MTAGVSNAMTDSTNAERQRRYIQRLKARASGVSNGPDTGEVAALKKELAQAKAQIAAATKPSESHASDLEKLRGELSQAKAKIAELAAWEAVAKSMQKAQPRPAGRYALTATDYTLLAKCVHPNIVARFNDSDLAERFNAAMTVLTRLKGSGHVAPTTVEQERTERRKKEEQARRDQEYATKRYEQRLRRQAAARKAQATKASKGR